MLPPALLGESGVQSCNATSSRTCVWALHPQALHLGYADGRTVRLSAEYLRVMSPAARAPAPGSGAAHSGAVVSSRAHVGILGAQPVGNYAIGCVALWLVC